MRRAAAICAGALFVSVASAHGSPAAAAKLADRPTRTREPASGGACARLAALRLHHVAIELAEGERAEAPVTGVRAPNIEGVPGAGPPVGGLPAFCRVAGTIRPRPGSHIRFEVWMPNHWNGRLDGVGNGGFAGSISYMDLASAVRAGQVGAATDTGHTGSMVDAAWAKGHPGLIQDYGWRAIHLTAVVAKELITRFYGRKPSHSYFMSCSDGGREALMEASRFPADYDGILAGDPAANFTTLIISMINTVQAQMSPGARIRDSQMELLQKVVLKQCDALDGQVDGLVSDPLACKVDVSKLACGVSHSPECFSKPQLLALERIYAGAHDRSGHQVAPGYPPSGAEVGVPKYFGWESWILGVKSWPASHEQFANGMLQGFFTKPFATARTFNFDTDPRRLKAALSEDLDVKPDLRAFFDRGGKLIIYHGWADPAIPPQLTLQFYRAALRDSGPDAGQSMRLFMVPGMQHCFGGPGPDIFGQMGAPPSDASPRTNIAAALQHWVERGRTPNSIIGHYGLPAGLGSPSRKERLICAYPAMAVLRRRGADPYRASSYECEVATGGRARRRPT